VTAVKRTTAKQLLTRVRARLSRAVTPVDPPPAPEIDESIVRLVASDADAPALFAVRAAEMGMRVHRTTPSTLGETIATLLAELDAKSASVSVADAGLAETVHAALRDAGTAPVDWRRSPGLDAHYDVAVGITDVDGAIAETGTLVIGSCADRSRGAHLVPPAHIAIVPAERIVADLVDHWARQRAQCGGDLPALSLLVSGPSKTADIEGVLVTGVHGPGRVDVVLVER